MKLRAVRRVEIDYCHECDGVFLDEGELEALTTGASMTTVAAAGTGGILQSLPHAYAAYRCPACKGDLVPRFFGRRAERHELYCCRRCNGIWLDLRELRQLRIRVPRDPDEEAVTSVETASAVVPDGTVSGDTSNIRLGFPTSAREWFVALTGFPIDVGNPCAIFPLITWLLILTNLVIFGLPLVSGLSFGEEVARFGLHPSRLWAGEWYRLITSLFIHGGLLHIVGNLFFLYTFGDNIEERYGRGRYLLLYVVCGVVAGGLSSTVALAADEDTIRIGASGAISGVLGAYLVTFPRTRILIGNLFLRFLPLVIRGPVWAFVVFWAGFNVLGWYQQQQQAFFGVDYVAHLAGFVTGLVGGGLLVGARGASEPVSRLRGGR